MSLFCSYVRIWRSESPFYLMHLTHFFPTCPIELRAEEKTGNRKSNNNGPEKCFGNKELNKLSCSAPQIPVKSSPVQISHFPKPLFRKMPFVHKKFMHFTFRKSLCISPSPLTYNEMFCIFTKNHRNVN